MASGNIAIVGGTGFEQLPPEIYAEPIVVTTRYGDVELLSISDNYTEPYKVYFLSRHGAGHRLAPHQINFHANTAALKSLGVHYILATNAVGSLRRELPPGTLVLFDDFIDFTRQRPITYFQSEEVWEHIDFSIPYSPFARRSILAAADQSGVAVIPKATYLCCDGPRFESPAEIRMFASWGADVVGMTGMPEVIFAKEAGIEYAALGLVTNFGAGMTSDKVDHQEVVRWMQSRISSIRELLLIAARTIIDTPE